MVGGVAVVGGTVEEEVNWVLVVGDFGHGMELCLCWSIAGVRSGSGLLLLMEKKWRNWQVCLLHLVCGEVGGRCLSGVVLENKRMCGSGGQLILGAMVTCSPGCKVLVGGKTGCVD